MSYVIAGYAITFGVLAGYGVFVIRRTREIAFKRKRGGR